MADAKSKKPAASPAKKIVDVKSGGDAASGTSKPVIVTNRAILKDPMMAEISQLTGGLENEQKQSEPAADQAAGAPELKKSVTVSVTSHDETEPAEKPVESSSTDIPAVAPSKKKLVIKPLEEVSTKDEPEVKADSEPEPTIADLAKPDPLPGKTVASPKQAGKAEVSTSDESKSDAADVPSEAREAKPSKAKEPAKEEKEQPAPEADIPEDKVVPGLQPGRSYDETEDAAALQTSTVDLDQTGVDEKGNAKKNVKKSRELTSEQQKAIESGEYFLPITTAETKRLRREIVVAVVLVILMIVVWLNIMLDAGLLELDGVQPLTDFFK